MEPTASHSFEENVIRYDDNEGEERADSDSDLDSHRPLCSVQQ